MRNFYLGYQDNIKLQALTAQIGWTSRVLDIGDRQKGRLMASSVIDCDSDKKSIDKAFKKLYDKKFLKLLKTTKNPYGDGGATKQILDIIKDIKLENILKKVFFDIKV